MASEWSPWACKSVCASPLPPLHAYSAPWLALCHFSPPTPSPKAHVLYSLQHIRCTPGWSQSSQFAFSHAVPWSFCSVSPYSTLRLLSTPSLGRCPDWDALPSSPYLRHHSFRPSLSTSWKIHSIWALFKSCYRCLFICPPCFYFSMPRNVGQLSLESTLLFLVPVCPFSYPPFYLVPKNHNFHFSPTQVTTCRIQSQMSTFRKSYYQSWWRGNFLFSSSLRWKKRPRIHQPYFTALPESSSRLYMHLGEKWFGHIHSYPCPIKQNFTQQK